MADTEFSIDYTDVVSATKAAQALKKSFQDMEKAAQLDAVSIDRLLDVTATLERGLISLSDAQKSYERDARASAKVNADLETAYLKRNQSTRTAKEAERDMIAALKEREDAERREVAALQKAADEQERLRLKYDKTYRIGQQYEAGQAEIRAAHMAGAISAERMQEELQKLSAEYLKMQNGQKAWSNQFVQGSNLAAHATNSTGMAVQQLGYQVGDFFVQIQGGTNPFVAFGQQATQLVGVLPMVSHWFGLTTMAAIGLSTALGIGIPIVTAIGAAWLRTSQEQDKAAKKTKTLSDELQGLDQNLQNWLRTKKAASMGLTVEELLGTEGLEQATKQVLDAQKELEEVANRNRSALASVFGMASIGVIQELQASDAVKESLDNLVSAYERLFTLQNKQADEQFRNFSESYNSMKQELAIKQAILKYGEDSIQVKRLEAEQQIANYNAQINAQVRSNEITKSQGEALKRINQELVQQKISISAGADEAARLADNITSATSAAIELRDALASASMASLSRQDQISSLRAQISAAQRGASVAAAKASAETSQDLARAGATIDQIAAAAQRAGKEAAEIEKLQKTLSDVTKPAKEASTKKSGGGTKKADQIGSLAQSLLPDWESPDTWYANALAKMQDFNAMELEALGGQANAKLLIEQEYQNQILALREKEASFTRTAAQGMYGELANLMSSFSSNSKAAALAALGINKALAIGQVIVNTAAAQTRALAELGPIAGPPAAAKIGIFGKTQAALIAATGLMEAANIGRSSSSSSSGSSASSASSSSSASTTSTSSNTYETSVLEVLVEKFEDGFWYRGDNLKKVFDAILKENKSRQNVLSRV